MQDVIFQSLSDNASILVILPGIQLNNFIQYGRGSIREQVSIENWKRVRLSTAFFTSCYKRITGITAVERGILKERKTKSKRAAQNQRAFFVPATEDWCGKELFENKEVREGFLSDMLKLPRSAVRDTEIINSSLWKRNRKEKQGIVDIRIRLNNDRLINIEIQVIRYDHWDKRQLYYLSKMYAENARRGEDYDNLPDCISIAILDFNLTDGEDYYHCYKLRDEKGRLFSSAMSIYILELEKSLGRETELDDWV